MAGVLPKVKMFLFLSIICLIINICVCCVAMFNQNVEYTEYISNKIDYEYGGEIPDSGNNVTFANFALATGGAFIPYFSIVNLAVLNLDVSISVIIGLILGIIGTLQLFLLITIVLNMIPKIIGSGFDV